MLAFLFDIRLFSVSNILSDYDTPPIKKALIYRVQVITPADCHVINSLAPIQKGF